jgi:protein SCO1/2
MKTKDAIRSTSASGCFVLAMSLLLAAATPASAQVAPYGEKTMGDPAMDRLPDVLNTVKIEQRLGKPLPLDTPFRDETGKAVKLGDYFDKKPVILSLVYYQCQILCAEDLNGLVGALEMVHLTPGKDFQIVIVSIDPAETPALAASKKAEYVKRYGRLDTADGWHFLNSRRSRPWRRVSALATCVCPSPPASRRCLPTPAPSRWSHPKG